jgi:hypothetical protein
MRQPPWLKLLCATALLTSLAACDAVKDASDHAADNSKRVIYDAKDRWKNLLTYHPTEKPQPQLPQTRYCYRMQSDIVCYDSAQAGLTAPMVGYQDGANIAWYQPGGGSTGYSGGAATTRYRPPSASNVLVPVETPTVEPAEKIEATPLKSPFKKQVK